MSQGKRSRDDTAPETCDASRAQFLGRLRQYTQRLSRHLNCLLKRAAAGWVMFGWSQNTTPVDWRFFSCMRDARRTAVDHLTSAGTYKTPKGN